MEDLYEIFDLILKGCNNNSIDKIVSQETKKLKPFKCVYMVLDELETSINTYKYKYKYKLTKNYKEDIISNIENLRVYIEQNDLIDKEINSVSQDVFKVVFKNIKKIYIEDSLS
ncbi:TPA: hypothetical protein ACG3KG_003221 [Clostridioides difficile]